jgi:thiamine-phosphate pyrophosphorylase
MYSKLQYISQGETVKDQFNNISEALDAGCSWVQLRFKKASEDDLLLLSEKVKKLCADYNATFIINDHAEIAKQTNADGVHLGLDDMPVAQARKIVGDKIIGGTANTLSHVLQRVEEGCNYVGLGPFRFTATKEKLSPILGVEGYAHIMNELFKLRIDTPIYAIGGIVPEDITAILQTGVYGVAVSGVITHHPDKKILLQQINTSLYEAVNHS